MLFKNSQSFRKNYQKTSAVKFFGAPSRLEHFCRGDNSCHFRFFFFGFLFPIWKPLRDKRSNGQGRYGTRFIGLVT